MTSKSQPKRADIRPPPTPEERLTYFEAWVNDMARPCPPSVISLQTAQALLLSGRVTIETLRKRGIAS